MGFAIMAKICIVYGILTVIYGIIKLIRVNKIKKHSAFIDGEIIELIEKEMLFFPIYMKPPIKVYPVVRYEVDGVVYKEKYKSYEMQGKGAYYVGRQVSVQYNIFNCSQYLIAGEKTIVEMPIFYIAFGAVMSIFFAIPLILV